MGENDLDPAIRLNLPTIPQEPWLGMNGHILSVYLGQYEENLLTSDENVALEDHLNQCAECMGYVQDLRDIRERSREIASKMTPRHPADDTP